MIALDVAAMRALARAAMGRSDGPSDATERYLASDVIARRRIEARRGWVMGYGKDIVVSAATVRRELEQTGAHVHSCPLCYRHMPCEMHCAVEPDMDLDDGTVRGWHLVCEACATEPKP